MLSIALPAIGCTLTVTVSPCTAFVGEMITSPSEVSYVADMLCAPSRSFQIAFAVVVCPNT